MVASLIDTCDGKASKQGVALVYVAFLAGAVFVYHLIAEGEFSSVLTLSAIFQCLAFSLLGLQMVSSHNCTGISAKSLTLEAFALACRLSSTLWLDGYLPSDASGDWMYQAFDVLSLVMVCWLLHNILCVQRHTYEEEHDGLSAAPFAAGSLVLAALFHGNFDEIPLFDTLWMCSVFVGAVAVIPQLWMTTRRGGGLPALTSHFVAVTALAHILSGSYMWYAYPEIECDPWIGNFQHAGYAVVIAHAVHVLLLGDFFYLYAKNMVKSGFNAPLQTAQMLTV